MIGELCLLLIGLLVGLGVVVYIGHVWQSRRTGSRPPAEEAPDESSRPTDGSCCGRHAVCDRRSLLAGVQPTIEYYDDEELDAYRGIPSDGYTDEQAEAFREVLYTMRQDDVPGWVRSLELRGIALPDDIKPEVILLVEELRSAPTHPDKTEH